jgi:hypothetical protein
MEALLGALLIFGLGILGLGVLFLGARYARTVLVKVVVGLIGGTLIVLQVCVLTFLAGVASATSGSQRGYDVPKVATVIGGIALVLYIVIACIPRGREKASDALPRGSAALSDWCTD